MTGLDTEPDLMADIRHGTREDPRGRCAEIAEYDAVLIASFGGPEEPEDVLPFLRNVTSGRDIPDERLVEVGAHYVALGGRSPLNDQNRALIRSLRKELAARGIDLPVYWGNRNWEPSMTKAALSMHEDGHRRVLAIATSAYSSYSSCRQYREDFGRALVENDLVGSLRIDKSRPYFNHPGFVDPFNDGIAEAAEDLRAEGYDLSRVRVLFSTHSIPEAMADAAGPREERSSGPARWYVAQHLAAARHIMGSVHERVAAQCAWELVYQSRSGPPHVPWLEPDVNNAIGRIAKAGSHDAVIVVPLGFVSDHVEVIWDLDTEARASADEQGLAFRRVATPATDHRFIAALADLVEERTVPGTLRGPITDFGPTPDVCGTACCLSGSPRGAAVPTTSALDSDEDLRRSRHSPPGSEDEA